MTLAVGTRVGSYEIVSALGAGGMGEVYRARDPHLGRYVAIKTLPEAFTSDLDRVIRFEREARALAALNHPNIATIHGFEDLGPTAGSERLSKALVMELVEGETLDERLRGGPLEVTVALHIARQLADGLEAAHEKGIIHRDLKPANVKITPSGHVKLLDFGLAKAVGDSSAAESTDSATRLPTVTSEQMVVGTPAYMSPEQVRGEFLDRRTDIWAFGCVLYEMLTGSRAFAGGTSSETLAEVLKTDPDWSRLPEQAPEEMRRLLRRCLRKDRSRRLRDIADARLEIEELPSRPAAASASHPWRERALWLGVTTLLIGVLAILAFGPRSSENTERRFEINLPTGGWFAMSPDGSGVAFTAPLEGQRRLWIRPIDSLTASVVRGTERAASPFWSADGRSIGFSTDLQLKRVNLDDGSVQTIANGLSMGGGSWNRDNVVLYSSNPGAPIWRIPSAGGEPVAATRFEPDQRSHLSPHFLPDGQQFLFFVSGPSPTRGVHVGRLGTVGSRRLFDADGPAVFLPATGHVLFVRGEQLLAQTFDPDQLFLKGSPQVVDERVAAGTIVSASATGPFAYREPASAAAERQLVWLDRKGQELQRVIYEDSMALGPALSHDGRRVAVFRQRNGNVDIWIYDVARRTWDKLTSNVGDDIYPLWSRDGMEIIFASRQTSLDLFRRRLDAHPGSQRLILSTPRPKFPTDWSQNGQFVLYTTIDAQGHTDVQAVQLEDAATPMDVVASEFNERNAQFSPDGAWIAYESDKTGRFEIYVRPFGEAGADVPVSTTGGGQPRWSPAGKELFYVAADDTLMAVPIVAARRGSPFEPGLPQPLFRTNVGSTAPNTNRHQYMVSPDGESFVMNSVPEAPAGSPVVVVVNWRPK